MSKMTLPSEAYFREEHKHTHECAAQFVYSMFDTCYTTQITVGATSVRSQIKE